MIISCDSCKVGHLVTNPLLWQSFFGGDYLVSPLFAMGHFCRKLETNTSFWQKCKSQSYSRQCGMVSKYLKYDHMTAGGAAIRTSKQVIRSVVTLNGC